MEADRSGFLGRRKGSASLKIQGSPSSLAHVIIICNDVTRAGLKGNSSPNTSVVL